MNIIVGKTLGELCICHRLPNHPGKCRQLHGHNYEITVEANGQIVQNTGMVRDFDQFSQLWDALKERFDHRTLLWEHDPLNEVMSGVVKLPFMPTVENIAMMIITEYGTQYGLSAVEVRETAKCFARIEL